MDIVSLSHVFLIPYLPISICRCICNSWKNIWKPTCQKSITFRVFNAVFPTVVWNQYRHVSIQIITYSEHTH